MHVYAYNIYIYIQRQIYAYVYIYKHVICIYIYICKKKNMHTYVLYIPTYIYIYLHIYIYTSMNIEHITYTRHLPTTFLRPPRRDQVRRVTHQQLQLLPGSPGFRGTCEFLKGFHMEPIWGFHRGLP